MTSTISRSDIEKYQNNLIFNVIAPFLEEIKEFTFENMKNLQYVYFPMLKVVEKCAFYSC